MVESGYGTADGSYVNGDDVVAEVGVEMVVENAVKLQNGGRMRDAW